MDNKSKIEALAKRARKASLEALKLSAQDRNTILLAMAQALREAKSKIQSENEKDIEFAKSKGLSEAMIDRLILNDDRFDAMVKGVEDITKLDDPIGAKLDSWVRPNGLEISKVRVPIGVIGIIYESRPNVTADAAALCVKTSNAVVLRGGSEAMHSNTAISEALQQGGLAAGMPEGMIEFIDFSDREGVKFLVHQEESVDLIIPRGGESLIRAVTEMSKVPVLKHYKGVCHTFVDLSADTEKAEAICINAKVQRPGVCNAMETLLVHTEIADSFIPSLFKKLKNQGVLIKGCERVREIDSSAELAETLDWEAEYLNLTLAVKIVDSVDDAIQHINTYGSRHTDVIVAEDVKTQEIFSLGVDTGVVMVNASSRFNDGAEFGFGAEIGISTDKLHARGPVGPEGITTYKYLVRGTGQVRQ